MANPLTEAFAVLAKLEKTGSSKTKQELLKAHKGNKVLRELFRRTYNGDKYHTFPDKSCKPHKLIGTAQTRYKGFLQVLNRLTKREITGDAAFKLVCVFLRGCTDSENKWYSRVLRHDMKTGVGTRTLSKIWPNLFATDSLYNGCMLAGKWETLTVKPSEPYYLWAEPKLDGLRCTTVFDAKGVPHLFTRGGKLIEHLHHITDALTSLKLKSKVLDGEMVVFGDDGQTDWRLTLSLAKPRIHINVKEAKDIQKRVQYHLFDMLTLKEYHGGGSKRPIKQRVKALRKLIEQAGKFGGWCDVIMNKALKHPAPYYGPLACVARKRVTTEAELLKFYDNCTTKGYEGVIVKDPDSPYVLKRANTWLKIKPTEDKSGVLVGWEKGNDRHADLNVTQRKEALTALRKLGSVAKTATGYRVKPTKKVLVRTLLQHWLPELSPIVKQRVAWRADKHNRIIRVEIRVRGRLGALFVDNEDGDRVRVGGKMSDALREDIWDNRAKYKGRWLDYSQQKDPGNTGKTRFPQFERWRVEGDK